MATRANECRDVRSADPGRLVHPASTEKREEKCERVPATPHRARGRPEARKPKSLVLVERSGHGWRKRYAVRNAPPSMKATVARKRREHPHHGREQVGPRACGRTRQWDSLAREEPLGQVLTEFVGAPRLRGKTQKGSPHAAVLADRNRRIPQVLG